MKECHASCGLKKACPTALAPGARPKSSAISASTTTVLRVEMIVPRRPPPVNRRGPRPVLKLPAAMLPAARPPPGPPSGGGTSVLMRRSRRGARSRLDRREVQVNTEELLLQLLQLAVVSQGGQRLVHAGHQRVALGEDQAVVLTHGRELSDQHGVLQLRRGHELRRWSIGDHRIDPAVLKRRRGE